MEKVFNTIIERLNNLIVVASPEGAVEYVSPSVKSMLGYEPSELLGDGWWNCTKSNEDETILFKDYIKNQFESNGNLGLKEVSYERQLKTASGVNKWILWNMSVGPDNSIISIGSDITKRKDAERALEEKNKSLLQKNEDIIDSIQYARKIQDAILPNVSSIAKSVADAFVLYLPKDVVSGDFYWYYKNENKIFIAAVDCTGHGVPGALMSIVGNSILKDVIVKRAIEDPSKILEALDSDVNNLFQKEDSYDVMSDGMDMALVVIDLDTNVLTFSGAMRPLWIVRNGEVIDIKGDRFPIGYFYGVEKTFTNVEFQLQKDDQIYLFSDGYADQFGGEKNKKFNRKKMKELLVSINAMSGIEQQGFLDYALKNWRQEIEQTDDVLVIGLRI
ncbi:MAG: SpoIIE family protein phosphatase [Flavobacteriales bacterium]|nr:SpoIIE family protein phosphatase [Flavobacteriales bacterium]